MMSKEEIQDLIDRYNTLGVDPTELVKIEKLLETGALDFAELKHLNILEEQLSKIEDPSPSLNLDDQFYKMLLDEKESSRKPFSWSYFFSWPELVPKFVLASISIIIGLGAGLFINSPKQYQAEVKTLTQEVSSLKEMIMLSMLEKESATERLRAVSLTGEMNVSSKVTSALLQTLNNDPNVNVRLAALEALYPYVKDDHVREALVHSIARQQSPLVQVLLAELMVAIQEKASIKELLKVLKNERTPNEVKRKIKESIQVLT